VDTLFEDDATPAGATGAQTAGDSAAAGYPLAVRMRPGRLDEFVGQTHLLSEGSGLRAAIEQGRPHSMVLYGPPGTGKTTLARLVASNSSAAFEELSAVQAGRAEVRAVIERASHRRTLGTPTVLFLDEIHRFNKAQQDALLPAVEDGLVTLIGATTENPAFEVNGALLSRLRVYALQALSAQEVATVLHRATAAGAGASATGKESNADTATEVDEDAIEFLAARSAGDARTALNALELALQTAAQLGETRVDVARVEDALQRKAVLYDKHGDRHYDYISAWIKATRGSDPDASLYYLAVMLEGGEDPRFIVRRMVILASEDVGNADPARSRWRSPRRRRSSTWACPRRRSRSRRPRSTSRWRPSPTPPGARWARPERMCASTGRRPCRRGSHPAPAPGRRCCRRVSWESGSSRRARPKRGLHNDWSRCAGCVGDNRVWPLS
jgi:replication-associated recombination protein RarA